MLRRPRLSVIQDAHDCRTQIIKDHITGEVLNINKIQQRVNEGIYSAYHVRHLNLPADLQRLC